MRVSALAVLSLSLAAAAAAAPAPVCRQNEPVARDWKALKKNEHSGYWERKVLKPRAASCYYLSYTQKENGKSRVLTLLVFTKPAESFYPEPPKEELFITRNVVEAVSGLTMPSRIWFWPTNLSAKNWGLFGMRTPVSEAAARQAVQPMLWWGLRVGQDFDVADPANVEAMIDNIHP